MARAKKAAKKTKKRKATKATIGRRSAKKATRRTTGRKITARKAASRKTGRKAATRKATKKTAPRKASTRKASSRGGNKGGRDEYGEGNYKASRRFRQDQENFVRENKDRIPEMGREAERALDGPEGKDLANAAAEAASHSVGNS